MGAAAVLDLREDPLARRPSSTAARSTSPTTTRPSARSARGRRRGPGRCPTRSSAARRRPRRPRRTARASRRSRRARTARTPACTGPARPPPSATDHMPAAGGSRDYCGPPTHHPPNSRPSHSRRTFGALWRSCCWRLGGRGAHVQGERPHRPRSRTAAPPPTARCARPSSRPTRAQGADTIVLPSRKRYELAIASTGEDKAANGDLDITLGPAHDRAPAGRGRRRSTPTRPTASSTSAGPRPRSSKLTDPRRLHEQGRRRRRRRRHPRRRLGGAADDPALADRPQPRAVGGRQRRWHRLRQLGPRQADRQRGVATTTRAATAAASRPRPTGRS